MSLAAKDLKGYTPTIGIECHVQLKTKTKLFAAVDNDAREAAPNTLISHICLGMPGALPVLNEAAVELAIQAAFALNTSPQLFSKFDRKHYFYPDLPKGYQISQFDEPIILGGSIDIETEESGKRTIEITRAHLEEDAGKSTHPAGADYSLVDLNRAGTPLLEIVSEPQIHTPAEAKAYARELYLAMKYAGVSDASLYYGNMRFDVNVSVSKNNQLGTRSETKNLNSFKSVEKAVEFEIKRQIALLESGKEVVQETRGWDDAAQKTISQRTKEDAHDYRYFADPDLPPIQLTQEQIIKAKESFAVSPSEWRKRLIAVGIEPAQVEFLLEAELDSADISYLKQIYSHNEDKNYAKTIANWAANIEIPLRRDEAKDVKLVSHEGRVLLYEQAYKLYEAKKLSSTNAKALITELLLSSTLPASIEEYAQGNGYIQVSDEGEIDKIVQEVIAANETAASDVRNGEMKAIGFLVGQVMKASKGKANPSLAQQLLKKHLQ